jgi:hypothetical protein
MSVLCGDVMWKVTKVLMLMKRGGEGYERRQMGD